MKYYKFLKYLIRLPIFKRLIPSLSIRVLKILKRNRGYFQIKDIKMYLDYLDPIDREIILFQNYEQKEFNHLCELINLNKVRIFVDVGANCGYYSLFVSQLSSIVKVFSYEPNNEAYLKFKKTLYKNDYFQKKIQLFNFGLSDTKSTKSIKSLMKFGYVQTGGASVERSEGFAQTANFEAGDKILNFKNEAIAIKIDVEGHEVNVLKGLKNILENNKCILQIEIFKDKFDENVRFLLHLNYKLIFKIKERNNYFFSNF